MILHRNKKIDDKIVKMLSSIPFVIENAQNY